MKREKNWKRRGLSWMMAVAMMFTVLPANVYASEDIFQEDTMTTELLEETDVPQTPDRVSQSAPAGNTDLPDDGQLTVTGDDELLIEDEGLEDEAVEGAVLGDVLASGADEIGMEGSENKAEPTDYEKVVSLFTALPDAASVTNSMTEEEHQNLYNQLAEAMGAFGALDLDEQGRFTEEQYALFAAALKLNDALTGHTPGMMSGSTADVSTTADLATALTNTEIKTINITGLYVETDQTGILRDDVKIVVKAGAALTINYKTDQSQQKSTICNADITVEKDGIIKFWATINEVNEKVYWIMNGDFTIEQGGSAQPDIQTGTRYLLFQGTFTNYGTFNNKEATNICIKYKPDTNTIGTFNQTVRVINNLCITTPSQKTLETGKVQYTSIVGDLKIGSKVHLVMDGFGEIKENNLLKVQWYAGTTKIGNYEADYTIPALAAGKTIGANVYAFFDYSTSTYLYASEEGIVTEIDGFSQTAISTAATVPYLDVAFVGGAGANEAHYGSSAADALDEFATAQEAVKAEGGIIVVCGDLSTERTEINKNITITGKYQDVNYHSSLIFRGYNAIKTAGTKKFEYLQLKRSNAASWTLLDNNMELVFDHVTMDMTGNATLILDATEVSGTKITATDSTLTMNIVAKDENSCDIELDHSTLFSLFSQDYWIGNIGMANGSQLCSTLQINNLTSDSSDNKLIAASASSTEIYSMIINGTVTTVENYPITIENNTTDKEFAADDVVVYSTSPNDTLTADKFKLSDINVSKHLEKLGDELTVRIRQFPVTLTDTDAGITGFLYSTDGGSTWEAYTESLSAEYGTDLMIKAVLASGYEFKQWTDGITENPYQITEIVEKKEYIPTATALSADAPVIQSVTGTNLTYGYTANSGEVKAEASAAEGHTITGYQWYRNNTDSNTGGTKIEGANLAAYVIPTGYQAGTYYYYCEVMAVRTDNNQTSSAVSNAVKAEVKKMQIPVPTAVTGLVYNGMEQVGIPDSTWYVLSSNKQTDAAAYTATAELADSKNLEWSDHTTQAKQIPWQIAPKTLNISVAVNDKIFDGTRTAAFASEPKLSGVVSGDSVTLVNGTPEFASAEVGTDITVSFTKPFAITGKNAANYTLIQPIGLKASITTREVKVSSIQLNKTSTTLLLGKFEMLTAVTAPSNATNRAVSFQSSNPAVVKVSADGKLTAAGTGTAVITCMAKDGSGKKAVCKVTVKKTTTPVALLRATAGKTSAELKWTRVKNASGYEIYGGECGKAVKRLTTIRDGSTSSKTIRSLKKGIGYKFYVKAYLTLNGKRIYLKTTNTVHTITSGGRYTNIKAVKLNFTKAAMRQGKTKQIKASVTKANNSKYALNHAALFRYATSNKKVATVSKSGKIKAVSAGTCTIYVYANNGVSKKITVTVK